MTRSNETMQHKDRPAQWQPPPVAAFILQEIKGQFLASIPHLVVMLVALALQSFVVPMGSAKILDDAGDDLTQRIKYLAAYQLLAVACNALQRRLSEGRAHAQRSKLQAQGYERVLRLDDKGLGRREGRRARPDVAGPGRGLARLRVPRGGAERPGQVSRWGLGHAAPADAHLAAVGLASAPLLFLVQKARSKLARRATRKTQALEADALARVSEALGLRSTVRVCCANQTSEFPTPSTACFLRS